jgi:hypothetical protein
MPTVNPQITDAVTQANVKVLGEAPAMAMGVIYQSLANATGILFENAVSAQQQQNIAAQAATNQGVIQIYSVATATNTNAVGKVAQSDVPDNMLALLTALRASQPAAMTATESSPQPDSDPPQASSADNEIEQAIRFINAEVFGHVQPFLSGMHAAVEEMAAAIDALNRVTHQNLLHTLQDAAIAMVMASMIREPEKAKEYGEVLLAIKQLV